MSCYNPIDIYNKRLHKGYVAPCGKCCSCLSDYQNQWKIRIGEEFKRFNTGVFFTLSYAPESAPDTGLFDEYCKTTPFDVAHDRDRVLSVCKGDVTGWLKRCRENMNNVLGERKKFKYFITAEYGPQTLRPHYHGIFLGISQREFERFFLIDWQAKLRVKNSILVDNDFFKGNVDYSEVVSAASVGDYIAKYCSKGCFENPRVEAGLVNKCFHLISKGLGDFYVERMKDYHTLQFKDAQHEFSDSFRPFTKEDRQDAYYGLLENWDEKHEKEWNWFLSSVRHRYVICDMAVDSDYMVRPYVVDDFFYHRKDGNRGRCLLKYAAWVFKKPYYEKIFTLPPTAEFVKKVVDRMYYYSYSDAGVFKYRLPRTLFNKIYGKDSSLSKAIKDYLQLCAIQKSVIRLEQIQTERNISDDKEAFHIMVLQDISEKALRERKAFDRLKRYYDKSRL